MFVLLALSILGVDRRSGDVRDRYIQKNTAFGPNRKAGRPCEASRDAKTSYAGSCMVGRRIALNNNVI